MGRTHLWKASAFLRFNSFGTVRHHQDVTLLSFTDCSPFVAAIHCQIQGNKKPCLRCGKQGERNLSSIFRTCLHQVYPDYLRAVAQWLPRIVPGETHHPGYTGYDVSLSRPTWSANSWLICSCSFSSNVPDMYHTRAVTGNLYFLGGEILNSNIRID